MSSDWSASAMPQNRYGITSESPLESPLGAPVGFALQAGLLTRALKISLRSVSDSRRRGCLLGSESLAIPEAMLAFPLEACKLVGQVTKLHHGQTTLWHQRSQD